MASRKGKTKKEKKSNGTETKELWLEGEAGEEKREWRRKRHHPGRCRLKEEEEEEEEGRGGRGGSKEPRPFDVVSLVELRRDFLRTFARVLRQSFSRKGLKEDGKEKDRKRQTDR
ncbi:hypothetical protein HZH68_001679 [Vespula germanica]|uniref:Uncharacterized protein n=1 Tax=Vespula germanica TaxID=30212 RepID=A0A834U723_VESGE|nr:hypothetical protein HZH68_001679 [Vespula germanica]